MPDNDMTERDASDFYNDEANRAPQGPPRRRSTKLTEVVPVRLSVDTLEEIKRRSDESGQSVSAWIRDVIAEKLDDKAYPSGSFGAGKTMHWAETAFPSLLAAF